LKNHFGSRWSSSSVSLSAHRRGRHRRQRGKGIRLPWRIFWPRALDT